ncbi:MAG: YihA family ribosome biogenesis GTP-binding protein [Ruminococcaceae bacterium]|nr:YihA family ribosome biogenesis GTP-binding protein [Oscillospiraceae bacterium]
MRVNVNNVNLMISAVRRVQYPNTRMPEIALAGRSNVGKSSMINKVLNRKKLARVSGTPGKTITINFYNVDNKLMLVDLPGYGYAARSKKEVEAWGNMINEYLESRPQLCQVVQLVDSRHIPSQEDIAMQAWIQECCAYSVVFATKCDKLSKTQLQKNLDMIIETLSLREGDILIPFSVKQNESVNSFWEYVEGCVLEEELPEKE